MGICGSVPENKTYNPHVVSQDHFYIHRVVGQGGFGKVNAAIRKTSMPTKWYAIKALSKHQIIESKGEHMVFNERNLLAGINSPFLVNMYYCYQDEYFCYLVMDLLLGGDLRYHLNRKGKFSEKITKFYIASIVLSLDYLHSQCILHRDIKPENIILTETGYCRVTDLGVSYKSPTKTCTLKSGTKAYMAPEIFHPSHKHGIAYDFYSLGVTCYEMLFKVRPVNTVDKGREEILLELNRTLKNIANMTDSSVPKLSMECRDFLQAILQPEPSKRLGYRGADEVKQHPWFDDIDWQELAALKYPSPFVPDNSRANFDTGKNDLLEQMQPPPPLKPLTESEQKIFIGYDYNTILKADDILNTRIVPHTPIPSSETENLKVVDSSTSQF